MKPTLIKNKAQLTHQTRLEVAASVTVQVMSTLEPLLAKMSGAPSILVTGTATETLLGNHHRRVCAYLPAGFAIRLPDFAPCLHEHAPFFLDFALFCPSPNGNLSSYHV